MGKWASHLSFVLTAIGLALQGCSSASDTRTDPASVPAHVCNSPVSSGTPKNDGAPCGGDVECLSNNCVAFGTGNFVCADPCTMGECSAGFACMGGYCFLMQTPPAGGAARLFDGDSCTSNAECLSGNCVTQDNTSFYCADLCTSGQCSENFQCATGYCVSACPSVGGAIQATDDAGEGNDAGSSQPLPECYQGADCGGCARCESGRCYFCPIGDLGICTC